MNKKCQVFTPENYVRELLDSVGYTEHLYGKKILENSCGDGNILVAVVQRYIDDCVANGLSRTRIKNGLARDIYGVEIDPEQYQKCIDNLNGVLQKNNINSVSDNQFDIIPTQATNIAIKNAQALDSFGECATYFCL